MPSVLLFSALCRGPINSWDILLKVADGESVCGCRDLTDLRWQSHPRVDITPESLYELDSKSSGQDCQAI